MTNIIPEHQTFLSTNFEEGIKQCEYTFRQWYSASIIAYDKHCCFTDMKYQNETFRCKIAAYVEFAGIIYKDANYEYSRFLRKHLDWETENEKFGVRIILPENVGEDDEEKTEEDS